MADGFLGRWSRRKLDVKEGRPVEPEPLAPPAPVAPSAAVTSLPAGTAGEAALPAAPPGEPAQPPAPPPTLEDVAALTPQSDFSRFTASDVSPEVRNAAMKKLFTDPHYNVMDGLDIYIDDYSIPDPMPEKMLKSLASAEFLGMFREEKRKDEEETGVKDPAQEPARQYEAQSEPAPPAEPAPDAAPAPDLHASDADPDLRLQQDHAPGPEGPGDGTK